MLENAGKMNIQENVNLNILSNKNRIMWFNSYFITNRAFQIIDEVKFYNNRYNYEGMFMNYTKIKVIGFLKNNVEPEEACKIVLNYNPKNYPENM